MLKLNQLKSGLFGKRQKRDRHCLLGVANGNVGKDRGEEFKLRGGGGLAAISQGINVERCGNVNVVSFWKPGVSLGEIAEETVAELRDLGIRECQKLACCF